MSLLINVAPVVDVECAERAILQMASPKKCMSGTTEEQQNVIASFQRTTHCAPTPCMALYTNLRLL